MKNILVGLILVGSFEALAQIQVQDWQGTECKHSDGSVVPGCVKEYYCDNNIGDQDSFSAVELWNTNGQVTLSKFVYHYSDRSYRLVGAVSVACFSSPYWFRCSLGQNYDASKVVFDVNPVESSAIFTEPDSSGNPVQLQLECR